MGVTITAKAAFERKVYRMNKQGITSEVEVGPDEYSNPTDGEKRVRITGYSEPFEMTGEYGTSVKTRVELLILEPQKLARQRFDTLMTLSVGAKANLGKLIRAARNAEIEVGEEVDLDDMLGRELYVVTKRTENANGYTNISVAAVRPLDGDEDDAPSEPKRATGDNDEPPY